MGQTALLVKVVGSNKNGEWIYRFGASPGMAVGRPPATVSGLGPGSALGSRPRVAPSSTQSAVPTFPARKPSERFAARLSLSSFFTAFCLLFEHSGSPSRPAGFALAATSRGFHPGLFLRLELDVISQLSV